METPLKPNDRIDMQTEKLLAELFEMQHLQGGKLNELRERVTKLERRLEEASDAR